MYDYSCEQGYVITENCLAANLCTQSNRILVMAHITSSWSALYAELKRNHDEAYFVIDKAIKLEEEGKQSEACEQYDCGLLLIDKALSIPIERPLHPDLLWEKASLMLEKMKKTKKEVLCRIADTQIIPAPPVVPPPPSYEEAMACLRPPGAEASSCRLLTYYDLGVALQELKVETGAETAELLYVQENVRIYFISPDGTVSAPSEPETLQIIQLEDGVNRNKPRAFLQVGSWIYPLVPGVSPCYRTEHNIFIVPDVHSATQGSAVGLIFPEEVDDSVYELLENILQGIVTRVPEKVKRSARRRDAGYSSSISRGIVTGAQYISDGLIKGAAKVGELMNYGTPKLIQKITPEPVPQPVNPKVNQGLQVAKDVTGTAVQITSYMASKIGSCTMALGRYLAPHIQRQGTKLLSSTCNLTEQEASNKMDGILEVAAGAVEGFSTVYDGLETSARLLASSLANNTVKIVEHKYGQPMGEAAGNTLYTVGNVFVAGHNVRHLTPKGIAKLTAKSTGKSVVEDYRKSLQEHNHTAGDGPSSERD